MRPPFAASAFKVLSSTCNFTRPVPAKVSVIALPAPSATVPSLALIVP
jgi:hypothetical protein